MRHSTPSTRRSHPPCSHGPAAVLAEGVISKELTSAAKRAIAENPDKLQTGSRNPFGMRPELLNLINESKFTPVLNSLIGAFDPPIATHVGILPVAKTPPSEKDMPCANASARERAGREQLSACCSG